MSSALDTSKFLATTQYAPSYVKLLDYLRPIKPAVGLPPLNNKHSQVNPQANMSRLNVLGGTNFLHRTQLKP